MNINLNKNQMLSDKYQQILTSEWSTETVQESLKLANSFLNNCQLPLGFSELIQRYENTDLADFFISSHFTNYLKDQSALLITNNLPIIPEKMPRRRSPSKIGYSRLSLEVIYNLAFPVFTTYKNGKNIILRVTSDSCVIFRVLFLYLLQIIYCRFYANNVLKKNQIILILSCLLTV